MKVESYKGVNGFECGADRSAIVAVLGKPVGERLNRIGWVEVEYPAAIYRFENDSLIEITINAPVITFGAVAVPFPTLGAFFSENDKESFEAVGFIVSPAYGVAFDPNFPSWVTAFPREALSAWRSHA